MSQSADRLPVTPTNPSMPENPTPDIPSESPRLHPIPPPTELRQYRAIGLVQGQYLPSQQQLTKGTLLATDGTMLDAVLLGRVMSLVKNHLDLSQMHLWVVYPRTRLDSENLHVQIVGVWEPENLHKTTTPSETPPDGYFSIRGEVIYYSESEEAVVVKIRQSPRKPEEKTKFFKLKLKGKIEHSYPVHRFWDLHVQLQGPHLSIKQATDIGIMPPKKRKPQYGKKKTTRPRNFRPQNPDYSPESSGTADSPKKREAPPKPKRPNSPKVE